MKTIKTRSSMGGSNKATLAALADFIARGKRAQEAVDQIIEAATAAPDDTAKPKQP